MRARIKMIHFERIRNKTHPAYSCALKLYQSSFPIHEQREELSQAKILCDNAYHFELIYDAEVFIGLVLYWETANYIYIEHLCILPEMRNKQYGKKTLSLINKKQKIIILEIDPPIDEISKRRKAFYEKCGFAENIYSHSHPPYHRGDEGHALVVMSRPVPISQDQYDDFNVYLRDKVMKDAFA